MFDPSSFPGAEVEFDKDANIVGSDNAVIDLAGRADVTDVVIMSHGWNNDIADARDLYTALAAVMRGLINDNAVAGLANHTVGLAGVFWPSKKFTEHELIPGGAAAAGSPITERDVKDQIDDLRDLFTGPTAEAALDEAVSQVAQLEDKKSAREQYATSLLSVLDRGAAEAEDATTDLFKISTSTLMDRLAVPAAIAPPQPGPGGALRVGVPAAAPPGGAAGLASTLGGVLGAARNLLNLITYYEMKVRAGTVGERGLAPVVTRIRQRRNDVRVHLVGHSFGGQLVSAAANQLPTGAVASMTLLQAAFSHYGFSGEWEPGQAGHFRNTVAHKAVSGPIAITHTANDLAVGIAYALASRIAGQTAAAVGDANDMFGGIGRNGAQKTAEAVLGRLLDVGGSYAWQPGALHNLLADAFIKGHSDITNKQVGYALLSAIAST